ncbi:MAG: SLC13 family permease [Planctomycetota bacterium]
MFDRLSRWMLPLGPVLATLIAGICYSQGLSQPASFCLWVALLCATWWIFECLHIAVVGLVPFVMLPAFGVSGHKEVAQGYGHSLILLLLGGFLLSAAMEKSGAHRRIALTMVRLVGGNGGRRLVLGFMLATALLSMWISNAATTLMMLPIALAVLSQAGDPKLHKALLLGMAYAASIGGMATPIGTPPNVVFMGVLDETFDGEIKMGFSRWMSFGIPVVMIMLPTIWLWVTRGLTQGRTIQMPEVGRWGPSEKRVLVIFAVTALLWMFRGEPYGGWSGLLPGGGATIGDATVALAASLALFVCPSGEPHENGNRADDDIENGAATSDEAALPQLTQPITQRLLDWDTAKKIPWGILLMFGGGLALATGFKDSGLSQSIGSQLAFLSDAPSWLVVLSICLLVTFLTEITSSTATATLLLPILAQLSVASGLPPEMVMVPGTISCSCAFMLPVATAPNVIVFGAGGIRTDEMARTGLMLNFFAAVVITIVTLLVVG